jgi:hypothetical protein
MAIQRLEGCPECRAAARVIQLLMAVLKVSNAKLSAALAAQKKGGK